MSLLLVVPLPGERLLLLLSKDRTFFYEQLLSLLPSNNFVLYYKVIVFLALTATGFLYLQLPSVKDLRLVNSFLFLLSMGIVFPWCDALPILIAMLFFLPSLMLLLQIFGEKDIRFTLFNAGFLLSAASFFWFYVFYLFPVLFSAILILYNSKDIKAGLAGILGLITPYFLFLSVDFFITNNFQETFRLWDLHTAAEGNLPNFNVYLIICLSILSIFAITGSLLILKDDRRQEARFQDLSRFYFFIFAYALCIFLVSALTFSSKYIKTSLLIIILQATNFPLLAFFLNIQKKVVREILFLLPIISVLLLYLSLF